MFDLTDGKALWDISGRLDRIARCLEYFVERDKKEAKDNATFAEITTLSKNLAFYSKQVIDDV